MTSARCPLLLAAPLVLAGACSSQIFVEATSQATGASGAAGSAGETGSGGAATSGGAPGGLPNGAPCGGDEQCASGSCNDVLTAFDGTETPGWQLNGSAAYDAATQTVVLAQKGVLYTAGTAIYRDEIVTDAFIVTFDFRLAGSAEGLAFMIETNGSSVVGATGGGLGVAGLSGYAVENDLWDSANCSGDMDDNHAGIDTLAAPCVTNQKYPTPIATSPYLSFALGDGTWRTEVVSVAGGAASVAIDGVPVPDLQAVGLPGFVPGTRYFYGFGASTGGLGARQEIRSVQITFPTPRCL